MRHRLVWAAAAVVAAIVIGCGPGKELPDETPASKSSVRTNEAKGDRPATSEAAAMNIVERAINAHTQNSPILLEKARISKTTAKGSIKLTAGSPTPAIRTVVSRWPDDLKVTYVSLPPATDTMTFILHGSFTWWGKNGVPLANINPQKVEEDMRADGLGSHWLMLLFPLTERNTIVYDARQRSGAGSPPADVIRVSVPGRPIYRLHFHPDTGLLTQVEYNYTDVIGAALTEWMLGDYKTFSGMLLPTSLKMARTTEHPKLRDIVQEWTVENWEFPEKLDEGSFDPPK